MSVARSLFVVVVCGMGFGAAGGLLGLTLGVGAPAYYRGVFSVGADPGFRPIQVGLGLGVTQGVICGLFIGSVIVLAAAPSRRSQSSTDREDRRASWFRHAVAVFFILAAVACTGAASFVAGAVVGQVQLYRQAAEARLARVRPILRELPFAGLEAEATSDGAVDLLGKVGSEADRRALEERLRFLFGDEEARSMIGGVQVAE